MPRGKQPSTGERIVLCDRADCAFSGDAVQGEWADTKRYVGKAYYHCEAKILAMDRRAKFGKTCGRFMKKGSAKIPGTQRSE